MSWKSKFFIKNPRWSNLTFKLFLPIVVFLVLIIFFGQNNLIAQWKRKQLLEENTANLEFLQNEIDSMEYQLEQLRQNPDVLEKMAREKYHQKREDEDTYLIIVE